MTYSCAVWERPGLTLEQAQTAKYELVARKLLALDRTALLCPGREFDP